MAAVPLQVKHRVHQMLQNHGTGNGAFFSDVADEKGGSSSEFGLLHQAKSSLPDLRQRARRRRQGSGIEGLNGIQSQKGGSDLFYQVDDIFQTGFSGNQEPGG